MPKYIVEFIGTYFLMLTILMTVIGGLGDLAPVAIGCALVGLIFAGGHISKAHYNPAVTLAFVICQRIEKRDIFPYLLVQILAAALAVGTAAILLGSLKIDFPIPNRMQIWPALLAEFLGTFALVFVILNVAIAENTSNNQSYGLAIGFIVVGMAYTLGGVSGGAFNPAVGIGLCLSGLADWADYWIYLASNFTAAAVAAVTFRFVVSNRLV